MKTWEIIKKLTENPDKEFCLVKANTADTARVGVVDHQMVWTYNNKPFDMLQGHFGLEWKEIKKPVSFMEAVASEKKIRAEHYYLDEFEVFKEALILSFLLDKMSENLSSALIRSVIENGNFYIED